MADMLREVSNTTSGVVNVDALKSEIRQALINNKVNACPIAVRLAWHSAGTFDKSDGSGGSDGARIRFEPESTDPANAGLNIARSLLHPIKERHPEVSYADLHVVAGAAAVEFLGGPRVPVKLGRSDVNDGVTCVKNGRLPDAAQGPQHLRDVFYRMGFSDREIVALSGAHTLGRAHAVRSGFDGPWTSKPLSFDNEFFVNLVQKKWRKRQWDGPEQFEDEETGKLMMLPSDIALIEDPDFKAVVEEYAADEKKFFEDFANAFAKLLALGCPPCCNALESDEAKTPLDKASAEFREHAMHGSVEAAKRVAPKADVKQLEPTSGRSALHKAAFWGHVGMVNYLVDECKLDVNGKDNAGDTPLHDAAKFGHVDIIKKLVAAGAKKDIKNAAQQTAKDVAVAHEQKAAAALL